MIPTDALRRVRTIVVHDNCPDGLASAVVLHDALPDADIRFVQYGTEAHKALPATEGILFCDFSPHPDRVDDFMRAGTIVLDHHRTAKPIVDAMGIRGAFGDEMTEPGVCGAVLAFRHVWRALRGGTAHERFVEDFVTVVGIRDTWQNKHPRWREACAQANVLMTYPREWWLGRPLAGIAERWEREFAPLGAVLRDKEEERVRRAIAEAYRFVTPSGLRVLAVQGVSVTSDAAEMLGDTVDLVAGFSYGVENGVAKVRFSLRSHTGFDCAAFAKARGGGGHTAAAGFSLPVGADDPQPFRFVEMLLHAS